MYNSIVVRSLVRLWNFFALFYDESILKRCVDGVKGFWINISRGSRVKEFFVSKSSLIDKTIFYRIYSIIIDIINNILKSMNNFFKDLEKGSYFCKLIALFDGKIRSIYKRSLKNQMESSFVARFIRDLFLADEEGDQWW